jgi:hypothetical protein
MDSPLDPATIPNPFKVSKRSTDRCELFWREDLIERLVDKLRDGRRMVAVVGASGSGRAAGAAGLIPPSGTARYRPTNGRGSLSLAGANRRHA